MEPSGTQRISDVNSVPMAQPDRRHEAPLPAPRAMTKVMVKSCAKDLVDIAAAAERTGDATGEVRPRLSAKRG